MALVTLADVQADMPNLTISAQTKPSDVQVTQYIADITAEVQAALDSFGVPLPADAGTAPGQFLRRTILEGAKWLTLRARYGASAAEQTPKEVDRAGDAYKDRLSQMEMIARALRVAAPATAGRQVPAIAAVNNAPALAASFDEWTAARDFVDTRRLINRAAGSVTPWPLL
jgi:hypothetical protein